MHYIVIIFSLANSHFSCNLFAWSYNVCFQMQYTACSLLYFCFELLGFGLHLHLLCVLIFLQLSSYNPHHLYQDYFLFYWQLWFGGSDCSTEMIVNLASQLNFTKKIHCPTMLCMSMITSIMLLMLLTSCCFLSACTQIYYNHTWPHVQINFTSIAHYSTSSASASDFVLGSLLQLISLFELRML